MWFIQGLLKSNKESSLGLSKFSSSKNIIPSTHKKIFSKLEPINETIADQPLEEALISMKYKKNEKIIPDNFSYVFTLSDNGVTKKQAILELYSDRYPPLGDSVVKFLTMAKLHKPSCGRLEDCSLKGCFHNSLTKPKCMQCGVCFDQSFSKEIYSWAGDIWHPKCFVCVQCFKPLKNGVFYEFDGRKFCQKDFEKLYASKCAHCGGFIHEKIIKTLKNSWHPECIKCQNCEENLADIGFIKPSKGIILCKKCHLVQENIHQYKCPICHDYIKSQKTSVSFLGDYYHPHHLKCTKCEQTLDWRSREVEKKLVCNKCFLLDWKGEICAACRRPIEKELSVQAMGKCFHREHFQCALCDRAFMGDFVFEWRGNAYCLWHYKKLKQIETCFICRKPPILAQRNRSFIRFQNKIFCLQHFRCFQCNKTLSHKFRVYDLDLKPVCIKCHCSLPREYRKRIAKLHKFERIYSK